MKKQIQNLEKKLGIKFENSDIIMNAFVHRSHLNESSKFKESNERLEYLGDAVLELATSEYLFNQYPDYQEGMLTNLRASLVKTSTLANVSKTIGFDNILLMSRGEEDTGGRKNTSLLANTLEAFLGALYIDQGYKPCNTFLKEHLFSLTEKIINTNAYIDNKSLLQELSQSQLKETPKYELLSDNGPDHNKTFIMQVIIGNTKYGKGEGKSKQLAQDSAAKKTLEIIKNT